MVSYTHRQTEKKRIEGWRKNNQTKIGVKTWRIGPETFKARQTEGQISRQNVQATMKI